MKMNTLPEIPELGTLRMLAVHMEYEGLQLFSCSNGNADIFLAMLVNENDERTSQTWIYAPQSEEQYKRLASGWMDIRDAILSARAQRVYEIELTDGKVTQGRWRSCSGLANDELPDAGVRLAAPIPAPVQ